MKLLIRALNGRTRGNWVEIVRKILKIVILKKKNPTLNSRNKNQSIVSHMKKLGSNNIGSVFFFAFFL